MKPPLSRGLRVFFIVWFGQLISMIGSGITGFALSIWVYQDTGSVTQFAFLALSRVLPGILISPLAGVFVDRWNRRWVMIMSDSAAALGTLTIGLLLATNRLEIWHMYLIIAMMSIFGTFQGPAYMASITLLVPKQHLGRANGMTQMARAVGEILTPLLAGGLIVTIGLTGIVLIDLATFLFAVLTLLIVRFPSATATTDFQETEEAEEAEGSSLRQELIIGVRYITGRPGLRALLIFFFFDSFLAGIIQVLVMPMMLATASPSVVGTIATIGGSGLLVGSAVMGIWGGGKRKIKTMLGFMFLNGLFIIVLGLRPSVQLWGTCAFFFFFCTPIINSSSQTILQKKVAPDMQGRVTVPQAANTCKLYLGNI